MKDPREYWSSQAEKLKKAGKFEDAVKALDKIQEIVKEEKAEDFWFKKAESYFEIKEYEKAKNALYKDLERGHKTFDIFFLLGKIMHELENYEESLECYNKASEEYSSKHMKQTLKIDQMKKVRKFEEAVKYSDMINQTKELDSDFWHHKGKTLLKLGKTDEGSSCFEKSLKMAKENSG